MGRMAGVRGGSVVFVALGFQQQQQQQLTYILSSKVEMMNNYFEAAWARVDMSLHSVSFIAGTLHHNFQLQQ